MNDEAVYRTAPATPGLLNIKLFPAKNDLTNYAFCDSCENLNWVYVGFN